MPPRPIPYSDEDRARFIDEVIEWVSNGKTLRSYCRQDAKPSRQVIDLWRREDDEFASRFARARDLGCDVIAEEALEIADTQELGEIVTEDPEKGTIVRREDMLGHRKLQVETRLKLLARWFPQRYGDRATESSQIKVDLPPIRSAADLPAAFDAVAAAVRAGTMTLADLDAVQRLLAGYRSAYGEAEFAREIAELRAQIQASKSAG